MIRAKKHLCLGLLLLFAVAFVNSSCNRNSGGSNTDNKPAPVISGAPNTTFPMPPMNGKSLGNMGWSVADGKKTLFADYKGKVLILDFYATWCEPCRNSIPHLVALQQRLANQGVEVVGLNVGGPEDLSQVPAFAKEFNIHYPLAVPDDDLTNFLLKDETDIPQTFVFDRQGQLARRFIGYGMATGDQIDKAVEAALKTPAH